MKYVDADDKKPMANVDVHVVTKSGKKLVARYWHTTGHWITASSVSRDDIVKKWRYADAT